MSFENMLSFRNSFQLYILVYVNLALQGSGSTKCTRYHHVMNELSTLPTEHYMDMYNVSISGNSEKFLTFVYCWRRVDYRDHSYFCEFHIIYE